MNTTTKPYRFLNRDIIKYIAILAMICDHVSTVFIDQLMTGMPAFYNFCSYIGSFTAITMVYFLVEGYQYTHSKKKYITRLFIFAVLSQIPFMLAFTDDGIIAFDDFNMLFTLCLCFGILYILETKYNPLIKAVLIIAGIYLSKFFDWPYLATIFTLFFAWARKSEKRKPIAFLLCILAFAIKQYVDNLSIVSIATNLKLTLENMPGMLLASVCILFLYNGKRMEKGRTFSKWFFYIFYPAHLLLIGIIRIAMLG